MKEESARAARGSAPTPTHRDAASPPDGVLLRPGCARSCRWCGGSEDRRGEEEEEED